MKRLSGVLLCCCLLLAAMSVCADEDDVYNPYDDALRTDRPDVADTAYTVGKLRFQLEQSFEYMRESEGGITTHDYFFPSLLRFGIIDPLEFRVESNVYIIQSRTGRGMQHGFSDVSFGFKGHVLDPAPGGIPALGLLAMINVPTGKDEFSSNAVEPTFKILMDIEFPANIEVGVNLGFDVPVRDAQGDKFARFLYAVSFNYTVHRTQNRWRLFVETSGAEPLKSGKAGSHTLNTGTAFLITPDIQIDAFIRVGITAASPDVVGGIGWAFRI